jgi:hypothetical protein
MTRLIVTGVVDCLLAAMAPIGDFDRARPKVTTKRPGWGRPAVRWHRGKIVEIIAKITTTLDRSTARITWWPSAWCTRYRSNSMIQDPRDRARMNEVMANRLGGPVDIDWHRKRNTFTVRLIHPDDGDSGCARPGCCGNPCSTHDAEKYKNASTSGFHGNGTGTPVGNEPILRTYRGGMSPGNEGTSPGNETGTPPPLSPEKIARIHELRADGVTYRAIADELGIGVKTAHKYGSRRPTLRLVVTCCTAQHRTVQQTTVHGLAANYT